MPETASAVATRDWNNVCFVICFIAIVLLIWRRRANQSPPAHLYRTAANNGPIAVRHPASAKSISRAYNKIAYLLTFGAKQRHTTRHSWCCIYYLNFALIWAMTSTSNISTTPPVRPSIWSAGSFQKSNLCSTSFILLTTICCPSAFLKQRHPTKPSWWQQLTHIVVAAAILIRRLHNLLLASVVSP